MKKNYITFIILSFFVCIFISCKKQNNAVWLSDFSEAKKIASSKNKNILLFVNSDMDVETSKVGVNFLLDSNEFVNAVSNDFVCVHFDFTDLAAKMAEVPEGATNTEQKEAEKNKDKLTSQFSVADSYMISQTPAVVLTTKEGYYITDVKFDFISENVTGYVSALALEKDTVNEVCSMVKACRKGSKLDRIKAIDKLYEAQSESHRLLLKDLYKEVPQLDKKNESGLVSKYIMATANADAYTYLIKNDIPKVIEIYEDAASDKRVSPTDSQTLYYIAANVIANMKTSDTDKIVDLLEKAIVADPESNYVPTLNKLLEAVNQFGK